MIPLIPLANTNKSLPAPVGWYGGKSHLRKWIVSYIPWSKVYCEPYGGAASVLCALEPRPVEIYNDLDGRLINLFRVLQDPRKRRRLISRLNYTPYSFDEFKMALQTVNDPEATDIDRAWAFFVVQNQGFSGKAVTEGEWSRSFTSSKGMALTVSAWRSRVAYLEQWGQRFARLQIDNRDALDVIHYWDTPDTVFYCDPPYPSSTRAKGSRTVYAYEASNEHLQALVQTLLSIKGKAILSCYDSPLWEPLREAGWVRREKYTVCHASNMSGKMQKRAPRIEVLWLSFSSTYQSQFLFDDMD